ncbi:MAG: hydroxymethylbilane synthase, partial [Chitinophagales bacterium]
VCEIQIIKTQGDIIQNISLEKLEGKGFFTKEIEDALIHNHIDVAVHSHKDLPTENTPGLSVASVSYREDASEVLLIRKEAVDQLKMFCLKENAIVGTSSSRRIAQLQFFRKDILCKDIRGNVPTRIEKLRSGAFDAILLAHAGVKRLNPDLSDLHVEHIPVNKIVPAPAQGVLAYQCRENDDRIHAALKALHHPQVAESIAVERAVMQLFQGGCHMPLGVFCKKENSAWHVWAVQADNKDGMVRRLYFSSTHIPKANDLFAKLQTPGKKSVFITKEVDNNSLFAVTLTNAGIPYQAQSLIHFAPLPLHTLPHADWIFFSSANTVEFFFAQIKNMPPDLKIAAIGESTAHAIRRCGYSVDFTGTDAPQKVLDTFKNYAQQQRVLLPQAVNARKETAEIISTYAMAIPLQVYRNTPKANVAQSDADILVFTSPLNVQA